MSERDLWNQATQAFDEEHALRRINEIARLTMVYLHAVAAGLTGLLMLPYPDQPRLFACGVVGVLAGAALLYVAGRRNYRHIQIALYGVAFFYVANLVRVVYELLIGGGQIRLFAFPIYGTLIALIGIHIRIAGILKRRT